MPILEVKEDGTLTLPREVLGDVPPHTQYTVQRDGERLTLSMEPMSLPSTGAEEEPRDIEAWLKRWGSLSEEISKAWPSGLSAVEAVSRDRR